MNEEKVEPIIPAPETLDYKLHTRIKLYSQSENRYKDHYCYELFEPWINHKQELIGYIGRTKKAKTAKKKITHQIFYSEKGWTQGSIGKNRPLLGENMLAGNEKVALAGEGEKVYNRLKSIVHEYAAITWVGGAKCPHLTNFEPLRGRKVIILPDNDKDGHEAAIKIYKLLCDSCDVKIMAIPEGKAEKWDIADDIDSGLLKTEQDLEAYLKNTIEIDPYDFGEFEANGRSPGQIAFDFFYKGRKCISFCNDLYEYECGYYKLLSDDYEWKKIARLLDRCNTGVKKKKYGYATSTHIREALNYLKQYFRVDQKKINPHGLNLKNGILRPKYLKNNEIEFELLPHSPHEYFTYQADFEYQQDIGSGFADLILDAMLDPGPQQALLRNIASTIDLTKVRMSQARAVRALILDGQGSNGKDLLRVWCYLIFGRQALSSIPIQILKRADSERVFQLAPLASSKINWASENQKIAIDTCQLIKQITTGETITVEKKHLDPMDVEPKIILLFNTNDKPVFKNQMEAIRRRFAVIPFPYVFKDDPDPSKPYEKKADPRFKEDQDFIKEAILPFFLNRLLKEFKAIIKEGVDYSFQDQIMEENREDHSHLYRFINHVNLVECSPEEGLPAKDIYKEYITWCCNEQLAEDNGVYGLKYHDSDYDKIIRTPSQMTKELKSFFPRLQRDRKGGHRRLGLTYRDYLNTDAIPF